MKFSTKVKAIRNGMEFSHGVRRTLILALALVYFVQMGFDVVWITTLFAASSIFTMFLEFPTGAVADYDSRKKSLMISFFLFALAFFGIYFVNSFWLIAVFWVISDIAWTFNTGAGSAWAIDALGIGKKKSKIIKLISRGYIFEKSGHIIGGLIGLVIIAINFRLIWLVSGLLSLVMFLVIWKYAEERNFKPEKVSHGYLKKSWIKAVESYNFIFHKKSRNLRIIMFTSILANIGWSIFYLAVPLFFVQTMGLGPEFYAGVLGIIAVLTLGGSFMAENVIGNNGFKRSLLITSIITGIIMIGIAFSNWMILALLLLAILKIFEVILDVAEASASHHEFDSKIRASLGSISSINWSVANSIGVFLAGIGIVMIGISNTLIVGGAIVFLTAFVYLFLRE
jgi:MFS family permease